MNDWVHCNKCSQKYNPNVKLLLTECGHMFCERCKDSNNNSTCIICNKSVSVVEISKDMDSSVRQFFFPIEEHLKKIFDVYNFQTQNTTRLLRTISQKYEYAKKECISCHKRNKVLTRELRMLKTMLMSMGQNPQPFLTSTPATGSDTLQGDNMSMSSIRFTPNNAGQTIAGYGQRGMSSGDSRHTRTGLGTGPYNYQSHVYGSGGPSTGRSPARMMSSLNMGVRPPNMAVGHPNMADGRFSMSAGYSNTAVGGSNMAASCPTLHRPPGTATSMDKLRRVSRRT